MNKNKKENEKKPKSEGRTGTARPVEDILKVCAFETTKSKVKTRNYHNEHVVGKHPVRAILSGASGSGKTNLLIKLLTEKKFYHNYFHCIFIISPTAGKLDDSYQALMKSKTKSKLHIINDLNPDHIEEIMAHNKKNILENEVHKAPRILLVYDDIISHKKFMNSKSFLHSFVASRHYNASVFICTQKFNAIPRTCRLQANAIFYFRGTNGELNCLAEEFAPAGHSKKEMISIIDYATTDPYSFFFVNCQADHKQRYRKNLDTILELKK
jgi:hypothetical protein